MSIGRKCIFVIAIHLVGCANSSASDQSNAEVGLNDMGALHVDFVSTNPSVASRTVDMDPPYSLVACNQGTLLPNQLRSISPNLSDAQRTDGRFFHLVYDEVNYTTAGGWNREHDGGNNSYDLLHIGVGFPDSDTKTYRGSPYLGPNQTYEDQYVDLLSFDSLSPEGIAPLSPLLKIVSEECQITVNSLPGSENGIQGRFTDCPVSAPLKGRVGSISGSFQCREVSQLH